MSKGKWAAIVAAITAIAGALGLGVNGQATAAGLENRVRELEVRVVEAQTKMEAIDSRLGRMEAWQIRFEDKVDKLLQQRGR